MKLTDLKQLNLPDCPGVYYFLKKVTNNRQRTTNNEILYVGKASSICDRVKSYFSKDIFLTRGSRIVKMLEEANSIEFAKTDSVLEALILEANEIKKHQPIYNAREKDDKSYNFVIITKEEFPRILTVRGRELKVGPLESVLKVRPWKTFGPFPHSGELKEALKIIRKIFPYRDERCLSTSSGQAGKPCFNAQIGLCPGPCAGWVSKSDYRKQIRNIKLFFEGRKESLIKSLERDMKNLVKEQKFEEAEKVKRQIFALDHIQDVALIKQDLTSNLQTSNFRIEAYDIAHISGTNVVGVMTVVEDGEVNKSQYRKFKIKIDKNDDTKNLKEVLSRRFGHPEWRFPNLIVVDGGKGQINAAKKVLEESGLEMIDVISVVKDERHKAREILGDSGFKIQDLRIKQILLANSEAHRFAIGYHRKLRNKGFRI
jgi:excinuclease UvrABC nuclease subunit